jgi:hypothetical protein
VNLALTALSVLLYAAPAPCTDAQAELPVAYAGTWDPPVQRWVTDELRSWFSARGRNACLASEDEPHERLILNFRSDNEVGLEIWLGAQLLEERVLLLDRHPLEGRPFAIAALAEELSRSRWGLVDVPPAPTAPEVDRQWAVGAQLDSRFFFTGTTLLGAGASGRWAPLPALWLELGVGGGAVLRANGPDGSIGASAFWLQLGGMYESIHSGAVVLGPRLAIDVGRLMLTASATGTATARNGAAWWVTPSAGLSLSFGGQRGRLALSTSLGVPLLGVEALDGTAALIAFRGPLAQVIVSGELRL